MDLTQFSTLILIAVFVFSTAAIWIAGMKIISAIDAITLHFSLGEAFGGMVFLAVVTNLPEIAITAVAAYHHDYDIAVSNLLGGIAIQTVVLVLIDFFGVGRKAPLTLKGHSKVLVLEGVSLIFILTIVMMAKQFSPNLIYLRSTPFEWLILLIWLGSIYLISKFGERIKKEENIVTDASHHLRHPKAKFKGTIQLAIIVFVICALVTLV